MGADGKPIVRLQMSQQKQAAEMLSRAFFDDPLMAYYLPDRKQRDIVLPMLMLASLRYCLFYGVVYTTLDLDGAACWLPPGGTTLKTWGLIRAGLGAVSLRLGMEAFFRVNQVEPVVDRIHKVCMPGPHWYLMILGVEPSQQGQGIGGSLIEHKLAEAINSGLPCYLETMTEKDVAFYSHHGFKVVFETDLPPGGLHSWMMKYSI
jgi:ribosomal protein S18 acetylase RimI-like enzyme